MRTLMIAILGLAVGGLAGAVFVARSSAQEAASELESVRIQALDAPLARSGPGTLARNPDTPFATLVQAGSTPMFFGYGQPGTWQIVTAKDMVLLLNSASGATFRLVQEDGGARWQPIEGQFPKAETARTPALRRYELPEALKRMPLPPEVDRPAVRDFRAMEELVRSFDNLISSLEARLKKETSEAEKAKIEGRLTDLRADRKKAAEELEKARAEDADQQHPAPRSR
jgi:hypothetical protein